MTDSDITVLVLREIRDSIRSMNADLSSRIDQTNVKIEVLDSRMTSRLDVLTERAAIIEHTLVDVNMQALLMSRYLKNRTEIEISDLRERVTSLEKKVG